MHAFLKEHHLQHTHMLGSFLVVHLVSTLMVWYSTNRVYYVSSVGGALVWLNKEKLGSWEFFL